MRLHSHPLPHQEQLSPSVLHSLTAYSFVDSIHLHLVTFFGIQGWFGEASSAPAARRRVSRECRAELWLFLLSKDTPCWRWLIPLHTIFLDSVRNWARRKTTSDKSFFWCIKFSSGFGILSVMTWLCKVIMSENKHFPPPHLVSCGHGQWRNVQECLHPP